MKRDVVSGRRSPTVRRRRLGIELRRLRDDAGLTIEQVAGALECSDSKISRIETGQVGATPRDVRDMLQLYGVAGQRRDALLQSAREARQRDWWQAYSDTLIVPLVGMEAAASSIRVYETLLVPGLFQTRQYAGTVIRTVRPDLRPEEVERWVEFRMARQSLLARDLPPALSAVLDEALLRRPVGGLAAMGEQLHHLARVAALPTVTLQVLPFAAGHHAGMSGAFTIFSFPEPDDPDVVYLEHTKSDLYLESEEEVRRYASAFDQLRAMALPPDDSVALVVALARSLA
jgi:transcriptional regulator with XRE-family HTH domain